MPVLSLLKPFVSPKVNDLVRKFRKASAYIWDGVYETFDDVPVEGPGFSGAVWCHATEDFTCALLNKLKSGSLYPDKENSFLPALVATIGGNNTNVRVLDFGGGMGNGFIHCLNDLVNSDNLYYHIVESENVCTRGKLFFHDDPRIEFSTNLPLNDSNFDIVYMNSVLQYVKDYKRLLMSLTSYNSRYILFVRLTAGDIPTFTTSQLNVPGSKIPCWFHNLQELHGIMDENGYTPVFSDKSEREYDQTNFPEKNRLHKCSTILYSRKATADSKTQ